MADEKKPQAFPPAIEEDEEEEDEEPQSTLPDAVVEQEAKRAIEEIDREMEEEHPARPVAPPPPAGAEKGFIDRAWDTQYKVESRIKRIGHGRYGRVLRMARKPEPDEFRKAGLITGIGIMIVGLIGFAIFLLVSWIMGLLNVT